MRSEQKAKLAVKLRIEERIQGADREGSGDQVKKEEKKIEFGRENVCAGKANNEEEDMQPAGWGHSEVRDRRISTSATNDSRGEDSSIRILDAGMPWPVRQGAPKTRKGPPEGADRWSNPRSNRPKGG